MPEARRLDELKILESSGVDRPANLSDGWLVMKQGEAVAVNQGCATTGAQVTYSQPPSGVVYTTPTFIVGSGTTFPPPPPPPVPVGKAQGPHSFKPSAEAPAVCAICGESKGAGLHYRFGQKALDDLVAALLLQQSPAMTPAQKKAADGLLSALKALRKEGGMPPDLENLDPDVKAHIDDLQAKLDAASAAPAPPVEGTAPTPPPEAAAPEAVAAEKAAVSTLQKALDDEKKAREEETKKAVALAERVEKMERKEREAEFVNKAKDLPNIGGPVEVGAMLLNISEKVEETTYKELERMLKAANAQLEKGALFSTLGVPGAEPSGPLEEINKLAAAKVAAGTATTIEIAKTAVLSERPDLRDSYYAAQRAASRA